MEESRYLSQSARIAKHHHKFLRSRLRDVTARLLRDAQAGARPRQTTDFVSHTTLTIIQHAKQMGHPLLLLFLDLKDAFYRVVLQFIYRLPTAPDELLDLMYTIDYPDFVLRALTAALQGAPVFDKAVNDEHMCALVRDARADLWATHSRSTQ